MGDASIDLTTFYALRPGPATRPDGGSCVLSVHDLGVLRVPSGRLGACDPFVLLDDPAVEDVPAGDHRVRLTLADVSEAADGSHLREPYLSVVLSDRPVVRAEYARDPEGSFDGNADLGAVPVDAGTVGFVDADAVAPCMPQPPTRWYDEVFDSGRADSWFARMDDPQHVRPHCANVVMPLATDGENVVLSHSGWGDGLYPLVFTRAGDGELVGVHIDLQVAGRRPGGARP
ncbi:DUF4241 domain-containing protein [Pedococcus sp. NPDC057267]|uniref:DUF4241 domain-containing protein n=1 Tax=Pedococcus sp. NPDC057267 TaxID=3346077 RepID=UPI003637843C